MLVFQLPTDFSLVFVIIPTVIQSLEDKVTGQTFGSVSSHLSKRLYIYPKYPRSLCLCSFALEDWKKINRVCLLFKQSYNEFFM